MASPDSFENIFESITSGVITVTPSGELLRVNPAAARLLGIPRDELQRRSLGELFTRADCPPSEELLARVIEGGETISGLTLLSADGKTPLGATIAPLRDPTGRTAGSVLTLTENPPRSPPILPSFSCTELLTQAPIGIAVFDGVEFRLRWANEAYRQFLEEPFRREPIGVPVRDLVPQSEERGIIDIFRRVAATRIPFVNPEFEYVGFARGVTYWRWALIPLAEGEGAPDLMIIATEITDQVMMRQRIEAKSARLRTVLSTLPVGVMIIEPDGRIVEANDMVHRIWGGTVPLSQNFASWREYRGRDPETGTRLAVEDWPASNALRGETVLGKVVDIERFDGTRGTVLISAAPLPADHGRGTGAVVVFHDLTEQRFAERALREKERLLGVIFDEAFQLTGLLTPEGRVLQINRSAADLLEVEPAAIIGRFFPDTPWWTHSRKEQQKLREGIEAAAKGQFVRFETSHRRPDGRLMYVDFSLKPVFDDEGRVVMLVPEGRDITERKAFERSLQESQKKFSRLFQLNPDWISLSRFASGEFIDVNEGFTRLTGYGRAEVIGRSAVDDLHIWADPRERVQLIRGLRRENDIMQMEARFRCKDGRTFIGWVAGRRLEIQGETCLLCMVRDITERKWLEDELRRAKDAAEAASRAKSEFLATVGHELRTPLTVTMGMTDLALARYPGQEVPIFLQTAQNASDSLLLLINDILDYAEMESGKFEPADISLTVRGCVDGVVDKFSSLAAEKGLELSWEVAADVPEVITSDPARIRQVLVNLIGNAVKFTPQGSVSVRVDSLKRGDGPHILFRVSDTGIGVPKDKRDRLFRAFSQVDSSSTRRFGGTGLGLAISKGLIERMGGRIWLEGECSQGSTFCFTLPARQSNGDSSPTRTRRRKPQR